MSYIRSKLSSNKLGVRLIWTYIAFWIVFLGVTIISYYLLPEGFLKNENPLTSWETANSILVASMQIFFYNMLSIIVIFGGSLFGTRKEEEQEYLSLGYLAFFTMICINAITLGTWSFSVETPAVPLIDRILRSFDLFHRAGLWEMTGQLFITCSLAHIGIILTTGKITKTKKLKDIILTKAEVSVIVAGFLLMAIGAVIESISINAVM